MTDLDRQWEAISKNGQMQFIPPVNIPASMLLPGIEQLIVLPALCSNLWMPPTIVNNDYSITTQNVGLVIGVRINSRGAPMLPFGLQGNNIASFVGAIKQIYVTLLSVTAWPVTLLGARGIGVAYSGGLTAAGTPSASPSVGGAGTLQS